MNILSIKSALVSTVLMAILATLAYIISLNDIFAIDWKNLTNVLVISLATGLVSLIKNYLTDRNGTIGGFKIK